MAKVYDISKKITNERPTLRLGEEKEYEIDDSKNTMLLLGQKMKQAAEDMEALDDIVRMTLGEKAAEEIDGMGLSVLSYQNVVIAIMAAVAGEEFEAAEARFRREQKKALK